MTCPYCDPTKVKPGALIPTTSDMFYCQHCGRRLWPPKGSSDSEWDRYFHEICRTVASKSPCLSRKIGAILVRDHSIVSTGYNGPPRGIPHCGHQRYLKDRSLSEVIASHPKPVDLSRLSNECPRRVLGYESGTHTELCPAQHAEENAVSNAARIGASTIGTTLYLNSIIPCKNCFGTLINAGIIEIVVESITFYDSLTKFLYANSSIKIREFEL